MNNKADIYFVQETMAPSFKAREFFLKFLRDWKFCATNSLGLSGGMVIFWNPRTCNFKPFRTCAGIPLKGNFRGIAKELVLLNVYGPFKHRKVFWDRVVSSGLLNLEKLI